MYHILLSRNSYLSVSGTYCLINIQMTIHLGSVIEN